jgi:hypothetical protein
VPILPGIPFLILGFFLLGIESEFLNKYKAKLKSRFFKKKEDLNAKF